MKIYHAKYFIDGEEGWVSSAGGFDYEQEVSHASENIERWNNGEDRDKYTFKIITFIPENN